MSEKQRYLLAGLLIACAPLAGCVPASGSVGSDSRAYKVEAIKGTDLSRVIVTAEAAKRLDLQTAHVRAVTVNGRPRKVIPYAAIVYDAEGRTWAYTTPAFLTFVRAPVTVEYVEGDRAVLTDGPAVGSEVVSVGVQELYGTEEEFEEE